MRKSTIGIIIGLLLLASIAGFYYNQPRALEAKSTDESRFETILVSKVEQTPNLTIYVYISKDARYSGHQTFVVAHDSMHGTVSVSHIR